MLGLWDETEKWPSPVSGYKYTTNRVKEYASGT